MLLFSYSSFSQIIKFQPGISLSNTDLKYNSGYWQYSNKTLIGYSMFIGIDYLNDKYYNLSTNVGVVKKGGTVTATAPDEPIWRFNLNLDYLSLNTTFEVKYPLKYRITPFLSYGPRLDYLLNDNSLSGYNQFNYGILMGGGLKYDVNNFQIAIRSDYYLNFATINKPRTYIFSKINDKTTTICFTIGYKL